ncbi:NAD(P)/FAD-dependent oxidoreductase [Undibacterium sp. TS12]|uniref:flavin-dependent monooxygenase QhpG n=1 Tax=Undibacterium sp. TS12 TaxID=2908202 RepID=UPI001F4C9AFA|nr:NAD(P)/FAD-dependent oxidoreductase [Undibacterium sp. TS12]MCH8617724.1 FAD-dependent monooxygenase [Undibacterium sp. TS12]
MPEMKAIVDALIIGAGPAGLTAALRLQQLGYSVHIVERSPTWPRPQIGEVLTPGIRNIVDMLDVNDALETLPYLTGLPTHLRWRSSMPETVQHGDAAVVNRGLFDATLMQVASQRGITISQPAQIRDITGKAHDWQVQLNLAGDVQQIQARLILDASGRNNSPQQFACAPRLSAMWAELEPDHIPASQLQCTQVEALEHGWLWGTQLPDRRYRIMWVGDPHTAHAHMPGKAEQWLKKNCAYSQLFVELAQAPWASRLQMCAATPYMSLDSWQDGRLKLGDAAFALDPISSSGVEKAMRFSLQAVVAVHTMLSGADADHDELARQFYEQRLTETCARHQHWTKSYYAQAWCSEKSFWQQHAHNHDHETATHPLVTSLHEQMRQLRNYRPAELKPLTDFNQYKTLRLHPAASMTEAYCVVDDKVQKQVALTHPNLDRPLSFLENEALFPRLDFLWQAQTLNEVLNRLGQQMPLQKSQRITAWLWQRGILESIS